MLATKFKSLTYINIKNTGSSYDYEINPTPTNARVEELQGKLNEIELSQTKNKYKAMDTCFLYILTKLVVATRKFSLSIRLFSKNLLDE